MKTGVFEVIPFWYYFQEHYKPIKFKYYFEKQWFEGNTVLVLLSGRNIALKVTPVGCHTQKQCFESKTILVILSETQICK